MELYNIYDFTINYRKIICYTDTKLKVIYSVNIVLCSVVCYTVVLRCKPEVSLRLSDDRALWHDAKLLIDPL